MDFLAQFLPIVIYFLLIILLIVGIILGIKAINAMNKVEKVVDDVNKKVESLNGFFNIIDFTTDKIVAFSDRLIDLITSAFSRIFFKKKKSKDDDEERENEEWKRKD